MTTRKTRIVVYAGVFTAIAVLLSFFSIYLGPALKVSLAPAAVIFAGIVMGPLAGASIGAASDLLVLLIKSLPGAYFPGFTITMAVYGFLGGILYRPKSGAHPGIMNVLLSTVFIQTVCSLLLNTWWLTLLTDTPFWSLFMTRLPVSAAAYILYVVILIVLTRFQEKILPNARFRTWAS